MKSTAVFLAITGLAALTGCATTATPPAPSIPAAASSSSAPVTATLAPTPSTIPPSSAAPSSPAATGTTPVPVLGQLAGDFAHGTGFGAVKPSKIFNGGDPTGLVTKVVWTSWGGPKAVASGVSEWVGPGQSVATGTAEPVRVVAFHLGMCSGKLMYQALEWYFPQHGQTFQAGHYEDICTGSYVPAS